MNAIQLLESDHRKVEKLFEEVKSTSDVSIRRNLFLQVKDELELHTHIEESIFYPRLVKELELEDMVIEGIEEHHEVKNILKKMESESDENAFDEMFKTLMEDVEHHVLEEENELFPLSQSLIDESEMEILTNKMQEEKLNFLK